MKYSSQNYFSKDQINQIVEQCRPSGKFYIEVIPFIKKGEGNAVRKDFQRLHNKGIHVRIEMQENRERLLCKLTDEQYEMWNNVCKKLPIGSWSNAKGGKTYGEIDNALFWFRMLPQKATKLGDKKAGIRGRI